MSPVAVLFHKANICLQGRSVHWDHGSHTAYWDRRIVPIKPRFHCRCGKTLNAELGFALFASWFSVMVIKGPFLSSRSQSWPNSDGQHLHALPEVLVLPAMLVFFLFSGSLCVIRAITHLEWKLLFLVSVSLNDFAVTQHLLTLANSFANQITIEKPTFSENSLSRT